MRVANLDTGFAQEKRWKFIRGNHVVCQQEQQVDSLLLDIPVLAVSVCWPLKTDNTQSG